MKIQNSTKSVKNRFTNCYLQDTNDQEFIREVRSWIINMFPEVDPVDQDLIEIYNIQVFYSILIKLSK